MLVWNFSISKLKASYLKIYGVVVASYCLASLLAHSKPLNLFSVAEILLFISKWCAVLTLCY